MICKNPEQKLGPEQNLVQNRNRVKTDEGDVQSEPGEGAPGQTKRGPDTEQKLDPGQELYPEQKLDTEQKVGPEQKLDPDQKPGTEQTLNPEQKRDPEQKLGTERKMKCDM